MILGDTIAAIATAPGRGGVAVIRVSGSDAFSIAERLTKKPIRCGSVCIRKIVHDEQFVDEAVVLSFRAPHSYTGEDVVEFQCHGGLVTPRRVLEACFSAGARLADRGEFTRRAFLNGRLDYDQAQSVLDLIDAKTTRAADAALQGLAGSKQRQGRELYEQALDLSTRLEYSLDVSEDELSSAVIDDFSRSFIELREALTNVIAKAHEGKILRQGALVVLAGPPNVGKSSLMNALLQEQRAIVSDLPGTTRDSIEEWLDLSGWPIRLVDTAGLRDTEESIEAEGVRRTEKLVANADIVLWLGDKDSCSEHVTSQGKVLLVHSKCDLGSGEGLNISSKTGTGLDALKAAIVESLRERTKTMANSEFSEGMSVVHEALAVIDSVELSAEIDLVLAANAVRRAAELLGEWIGATYSSDLIDNLFSRFCVGK